LQAIGSFRSAAPLLEIRLWDSKDLIAMLLRNYEALPDDFQADIPLERIWTLVPDEPN
jgi:restriction system protein